MDFWQKLLLQSVGPLITAVVGTLIIGTFVAWITRRAQERRAGSQLQEERIRAQNQLRLQLIGQMTEAASSLYMATQNYRRNGSADGSIFPSDRAGDAESSGEECRRGAHRSDCRAVERSEPAAENLQGEAVRRRSGCAAGTHSTLGRLNMP